MNKKIIKNIALSLIVAASCNVGIVSANAASSSIPQHAQPGTRIQYDKNGNMNILKGKIDESKSSTSVNNSLPSPQAGMTVSYDGAGDPTFIKINGETYSNKTKDSSTNKNDSIKSVASASSYFSKRGAISWYDDKYGQSDHRLADYDCATDQNIDNCALGTRIYVEDTSSGIWGTFKKWDVGNLQAQSTPRVVDVWDVQVFEDVFQLENGFEQGIIKTGYYYHN